MSDIDVAFCRSLLKEATKLVRQNFPNIRLRDA